MNQLNDEHDEEYYRNKYFKYKTKYFQELDKEGGMRDPGLEEKKQQKRLKIADVTTTNTCTVKIVTYEKANHGSVNSTRTAKKEIVDLFDQHGTAKKNVGGVKITYADNVVPKDSEQDAKNNQSVISFIHLLNTMRTIKIESGSALVSIVSGNYITGDVSNVTAYFEPICNLTLKSGKSRTKFRFCNTNTLDRLMNNFKMKDDNAFYYIDGSDKYTDMKESDNTNASKRHTYKHESLNVSIELLARCDNNNIQTEFLFNT